MSSTVGSRKPRSSSTLVRGDAPPPTSIRASAAETPGRAEHPERHVRMLLGPAPGVIALGVGGVPVRRCLRLVRHLLILRAARASKLAEAIMPGRTLIRAAGCV